MAHERHVLRDRLIIAIPALAALYLVLQYLSMITGSSSIRYSTVGGFFRQDDIHTNASTFDYTTSNFGLINRKYSTEEGSKISKTRTQWQAFDRYLKKLNDNSAENVQYKLLFMGRHGEGYHNVAESLYGTPAWDCYWSLQDGDGELEWSDAQLTSNGKLQAEKASAFWAKEMVTQKIPTPESYYVSPLTRCMQTANITFGTLSLDPSRAFRPTVKELLREGIGIHTCDRRSSKSFLHEKFPHFRFEDGFVEEDPFWKADLRESQSTQVIRMKALLDDIFRHDRSTYISFTSHSGSIAALLIALDHREFQLTTGAVIPVLVKAETVIGPPPAVTQAPSGTVPACESNPTII